MAFYRAFFGVGAMSDKLSAQRRNTPIEAQNMLPMSRMTVEHCDCMEKYPSVIPNSFWYLM